MRKIHLAWLVLAVSQPSESITIEGDWANSNRTVVVRITSCGAAFCGYVVQASEGALQDALRGGTVNLIGTEVLSEFVPAGADRWKGWLFVPDKAVRTRARIVVSEADDLELIGCDRTGLFCRTQVWHRVSR